MDNARTRETTKSPLPKRSGATAAAAHTSDACDLLLAELQARRTRLRQLLDLVQLEAIRLSSNGTRGRQRAHCISTRLRRPA